MLNADQTAQRDSLIKAKNSVEQISIFAAMDIELVKKIYNNLPGQIISQMEPEINHIIINKSVSPKLYHQLSEQDGIRDFIARRILYFYSKGIFLTVNC